MKIGAHLVPGGVEYCVWAPDVSNLTVQIQDASCGAIREVPLSKTKTGHHCGCDVHGQAGDAYGFQLEKGLVLPDPASRAQREDVHGFSLVVDPRQWVWKDGDWRRPQFRDLVLYEMHVGTFTPQGTFSAAAEKLPYLASLGVNAIELMPIADFPGSRNWGYDGVLIYAPARCYGSPDDLRSFVDAAHVCGVAVILDVVYNHLGPDGNYLSSYSKRYFSPKHHTPWGQAVNFDAKGCSAVRDFFLNNLEYWMEEFHIDGFRLDAIHEIHDDSVPHILTEMSTAIHSRGGYAIAEDDRNDTAIISPDKMNFDAVWADDFHHTVRVSQTGEQLSYFQDFTGDCAEISETLQHGWLYHGQKSVSSESPRGTECNHLQPASFIHCISNHDQTGNQALGERINHLISPEAYRALSMFLCLTPYTPLLFMGQEWASSTPFLFFTDHKGPLGQKITEGRRKEFAALPAFDNSAKVPDPQAPSTFLHSKLNWKETEDPSCQPTLALYRECLKLRRETPAFRPSGREDWSVQNPVEGVIGLTFDSGTYLLLLNPNREVSFMISRNYETVLSSEESRFGGSGNPSLFPPNGSVEFETPEALLLKKISGTA